MLEKRNEVSNNKINKQGPEGLCLRSGSIPKNSLKPKGKIREEYHKISVVFTVGNERIVTK